MATIGDLHKVAERVLFLKLTQGYTGAFIRGYHRRLRAVVSAIHQELYVKIRSVSKLPRTQVIPQRAQQIFEQLKTWLAQQHPELQDLNPGAKP